MATWGTSSYFLGRARKNWADARQACQNACGDLASIETKEELELVVGEVGRVTEANRWVWVGAKRVSGTKEFEWFSGARLKEDDEAWKRRGLSGAGGGEDCVVMWSGASKTNAYSDISCTVAWATSKFLCEMPGLYFLTISISFELSPVDNEIRFEAIDIFQ
jgi:hypothetical protein